MPRYLLIESQDPLVSRLPARRYALARSLAGRGHRVTLLLVQNAVGVACNRSGMDGFDMLLDGRITVCVDRFALQERGLAATSLKNGIRVVDMDMVAQSLLAGDKVIWH